MSKCPLESLATRFLRVLAEHADTVIIMASVPGKKPNEPSKKVSLWIGNQFAAEWMATNFSTNCPDDDYCDDDDEPSQGDPRVSS
jgi:hypothetical protein